MATQAYEHQDCGDSKKDTNIHLWPSSSQSNPSNGGLAHTLVVNDDLSSSEDASHMAELTTSAPTCQSCCCESPTWTSDGTLSCNKMRTLGQPRQHHVHQHHHHYHYYQCPAAACSCPSNGVSASTVKKANPSQVAPHAHTHTHLLVSSHRAQPHCPCHAAEHTNCPLLPTEHAHCPLHPQEYTHCALHPEEHTPIAAPCSSNTHIAPSTEHVTKDTRTHIAHFSDPLAKCTPTTPSTERRQQHNDTDLYATPQVHLKKPKKPKTHESKVYIPFPSPNAPPYILCQHCFKLLSLPLSPPLHLLTLDPVLKLKCALCARISVFLTHCRRGVLPSSDGIQLGHIQALKASKGITDGDSQFMVEQKSMDVDVLSFDASLTDGGFLLRLEQENMDAYVHMTDTSIDGLKRELRSREIYVPIIDTFADSDILHIKEQEITDANLLINNVTTEGCRQGNYSCPGSPPKLNPEFAGFSSVQDWVNSIEQESFLHCPTPLIGTGFGSDLQLQEPVDWRIDDDQGGDAFSLPVPGSPLHEHFGYKSPLELLNKTLSSDDEIKMPSDTNSSLSTSATSANTFKPPGFENVDASVHKNACKGAFVKQGSKNSTKSSVDIEQNDQGSLAGFFRRGLKGFGERSSSSVSGPKTKVIVNGHSLSQLVLKRAEEQAGKLRPGTYWYDSKAGFWGVTGGPCLGVLPPFIEELHYPMTGDCSNGDTQIFVNGRELHHKDLAVLAPRGLSKKPGMAYVIGFDGVVIEETSGRELKHLGKLAPTVERRGKGFGMYMPKQ